MLSWFECDKAWIGVEQKDYKKAELVFEDLMSRRNSYSSSVSDYLFIATPLSLWQVMMQLEKLGVDYWIQGRENPNGKGAQATKDIVLRERLATFSTRPLIDAIQEHLDALTKKYEGCEKPMDSECYWLLRDIAKHILQQHKS